MSYFIPTFLFSLSRSFLPSLIFTVSKIYKRNWINALILFCSGEDIQQTMMKKVNNNQQLDDVWFEICLRLPLDSIFKFKCISKVWCSTLSNPNFINQWYKLNISSLPWGLVLPNNQVEKSPDGYIKLRRFFTIAVPDLHSQFVSHHKNGFLFNFLNDQGWKETLLLGSSNGLVLCHTKLSNGNAICVCNPLTQKWVAIPPYPPRQDHRALTGFMCGDESSLISTSFKIIRLVRFEDGVQELEVHMFSSELGQWNVYNISCPGDVTWNFSVRDNLVAHNGVFYWFQKKSGRILAVSVNAITNHHNECRLIDLPDRPMDGDIKLHQHLGESEGLVCYAIVKEKERSLSVWVLREDWSLLCKDNEFHDVLAKTESLSMGGVDLIAHIVLFGFSPLDKNVVILGYDKYIWAYNTRTKGCERLSHPLFLHTNGSVSHVSLCTFAIKPRPSLLPPVSW